MDGVDTVDTVMVDTDHMADITGAVRSSIVWLVTVMAATAVMVATAVTAVTVVTVAMVGRTVVAVDGAIRAIATSVITTTIIGCNPPIAVPATKDRFRYAG